MPLNHPFWCLLHQGSVNTWLHFLTCDGWIFPRAISEILHAYSGRELFCWQKNHMLFHTKHANKNDHSSQVLFRKAALPTRAMALDPDTEIMKASQRATLTISSYLLKPLQPSWFTCQILEPWTRNRTYIEMHFFSKESIQKSFLLAQQSKYN